MTASTPNGSPAAKDDVERRDALAGRLFGAGLQALELLTVYLGDRLGLYQALADGEPATAGEVAQRAGVHERYAREWVEQQAVAGILDVVDSEAGSDASARRFRLAPGHAEVLLDPTSLSYVAPLGRYVAALGSVLPALLAAYRQGGGVSWADYGDDARAAQAAFNRPMFATQLAAEWFPAIPALHARLQSEPPARIADIDCGAGWSSLAIAQAYPKVRVDGFDLDAPSIDLAQTHAAEAGLGDRVVFQARDAGDATLTGQYDLVTAFECIHDLAHPVEVLATARRLLSAGGAMLIVDERVAETFTAPGDEMERLFYGFSVLCCLPAGMAEPPSAATGTVMRPQTLQTYALRAGFATVDVLPITHNFFRFYLLQP